MMKNKRLLIIGAGEAGLLLLNDIRENHSLGYEVVGFIDDYRTGIIENISILGKTPEIQDIVNTLDIKEIIIAIPSLSGEKLKELVNICKKTGLETKILPSNYEGLYSFKTGRPWYKPAREISMEDLLRRKPILIDLGEIEDYISGKVILVTGGGGSIGSELCKQIAELSPKTLIILDNCEYNLYEIDHEIKDRYSDKINFKAIIGDVKDEETIKKIFSENQIDTVFHAAAYKHVPLMESNIKEAIKNNVFGTYNLASLSSRYGAKNFVLISTDKAVNPTSIMGTTKRVAEMIMQLFDQQTKFTTVRFGNVLGSKGSVIPLFEKQIKNGGPITITHPEITRYFMTIPEAVQLVIQAGAIGNNKDILVLDMGQPYKVVDLARDLIRLYGLEPEEDIKIEYIGLRPGEKLYEELLTAQEGLLKTKNNRIFVSKTEEINKEKLEKLIFELRNLVERGEENDVLEKIKEIVPSYTITKNNEFSDLKKLKILITGSRGFIGNHLKNKLTCLGISWKDVDEGIDLSDKENFRNLPPADLVFHLASKIPQKENEGYEKDIEIMKNVINFCEKNKSVLIFPSSCAVYGNANKNLVSETSALNPINDYGRSKLACEDLFNKSKVNGAILRLFNVYGKNQYSKFVVPSLIKGASEGKVNLAPETKRDFVNISDVIDSMLRIAILCRKNKDIFNIGSGVSTKLEDIVELIEKRLNQSIKINYQNQDSGIKEIYADITKAKKILNWQPKISLHEGIKEILFG